MAAVGKLVEDLVVVLVVKQRLKWKGEGEVGREKRERQRKVREEEEERMMRVLLKGLTHRQCLSLLHHWLELKNKVNKINLVKFIVRYRILNAFTCPK